MKYETSATVFVVDHITYSSKNFERKMEKQSKNIWLDLRYDHAHFKMFQAIYQLFDSLKERKMFH